MPNSFPSRPLSRRAFTQSLATAGVFSGMAVSRLNGILLARQAPAAIRREGQRSLVPCGVASGDVTSDSAVVWSKTDRPAKVIVYLSEQEFRSEAQVIQGGMTRADSDYTIKIPLKQLSPGKQYNYSIQFIDPDDRRIDSELHEGTFRTPDPKAEKVVFAWSGDTAGQGYGINPAFGGYKIYKQIQSHRPDFFIHSGDNIYADNPIPPAFELPDGTVWRNLTTEAKSKVAETLAEFHGNYAYNLQDEHQRAFQAAVPLFAQWDDHEVLNNWYPGELLDDPRYTERRVDVLAARGRRAFLDYLPIHETGAAQQIYRKRSWSDLLDLFLIDLRSERGANNPNRQKTRGPETAFMGDTQLAWLKRELKASTAAWKVIACDMPLALILGDGAKDFEGFANGDPGKPLGRELEIADLLGYLQREKIRNTVWLTADVHYAAAHYYDPAKAQFTEFDPFWEFVAGPLNAGTYGPNRLDATFGPEVKFCSVRPGQQAGRGPAAGDQFYGVVTITRPDKALTVELYNLAGKKLYAVTLE